MKVMKEFFEAVYVIAMAALFSFIAYWEGLE